jgi:hypothetical protein
LEGIFLFPCLQQSRLESNSIEFACSIGLSHASPNNDIVLNLTLEQGPKKEHFNAIFLPRVSAKEPFLHISEGVSFKFLNAQQEAWRVRPV